MAETGKAASRLARQVDGVPQMLRKVRYSAGAQPLAVPGVQEMIDEARARLNGAGRLVIRTSGTEPLIRVMAECEDARLLEAVAAEIAVAVERAA
jgi:phosphoglucosamine mutase